MKGSTNFSYCSNNAIFQHFFFHPKLMLSNPQKAENHQENACGTSSLRSTRGSSSSISWSCHGWASSRFGWIHSKLSYEVRTPQETNEGRKNLSLLLQPDFANLVGEMILKSLKIIREITGNPENIFSASPQHRKREIRQSQGICRPAGWFQKPASFCQGTGMPMEVGNDLLGFWPTYQTYILHLHRGYNPFT